MGSSRRSWFPLAALGFAQLIMVLAELLPGESLASTGEFTSLRGYQMSQELRGLGTNVLSGVGYPAGYDHLSVVTAVDTVPSATLGWLVGLACVVLAVAGWYWLSLHRAGTPPRTGRFVLAALGALAAIPLLDLVGALQLRIPGDVRGPLLATLGLLLLAGYERSWLVLAVTVVFALVTVVFLPPVAGALCAVGVLFAGAFAVLLRGPRGTAADAV
ncbi:hypothetical protein ACIOD2_35155 [Amycolatopsis sp. NPDC088138]|uniref:hypothetical protein n=1 Tax=Amycolatopsis sp. NPDC088138 TaxID=3363938 RepID=UPI00382AE916